MIATVAFFAGTSIGIGLMGLFATRAYDRGAAEGRAQALKSEETRRVDSYDQGYTAGFQAGKAGVRAPMHTTVIVDPDTFHRYRDLIAANRRDATAGAE